MAEVDIETAEAIGPSQRIDNNAAEMTAYLLRPVAEMAVILATASLERDG